MTPQDWIRGRPPFAPRRWLGNGHAMTVFTWARSRQFPDLPAAEPRLFRTAPDTQVLAHCFWQPSRATAPTVLVLHGLEGSTEAHYMRGLAAKAWRRGWNAVLLNQRNCGGTDHLTPTLYHSGLTLDPREVIRTMAREDGVRAVGVIGYSLGGNLAVKLSGELDGTDPLPVNGVVAVSPTIDLELCVRAIERRRNIPYHYNFVRNLKRHLRRKARFWPDLYDLRRLASIWTIRQFDEVYTAPAHGFQNAADYYHRASALRDIHRVATPTLILASADDPFVPPSQFRDPALAGNPHIGVGLQSSGGHCGFAGAPASADDGYWAETTAIEFLASVMPR